MDFLDWFVIFLYLVTCVGLGIYFYRTTPTEEDFLFASRSVPNWVVTLSLLATSTSTISLIAVPAEVVRSGPDFIFHVLAIPLGFILVIKFALPAYYTEDKPRSIFLYLRNRTGRSAEILMALLFLLARISWVAMIFYTSSFVISSVLDISLYLVMTIIALISTIYVTAGGIRAVIYTDAFQSIIMFGVLTIAVIYLLSINISSGEIDDFINKASIATPMVSSISDNSIIAIMVWTVAIVFAFFASNQINAQIYFSTSKYTDARKAIFGTMWAMVITTTIMIVLGLSLYAYFINRPGLIDSSIGEEADSLLIKFVDTKLPIGLFGVFVSGLLAAAMSSIDSVSQSFNSVYRINIKKSSSSFDVSVSNKYRIWSGLITILALAIAMLVSLIDGSLLKKSIVITSLFEGPIAGVFFMIFIFKRITSLDVIIGALIGVFSALFVVISSSYCDCINISFFWFLPMSMIITMLGMFIVCNVRHHLFN